MKLSTLLVIITSAATALGAVDSTDNTDNVNVAATKRCNNGGTLGSKVGKCDPSQSKGILSAHNCKNKGGRYYYCVQGGQGACGTIRVAQQNQFEGGECFL